MKRFGVLTIAAALAVTTLAGCGSNSSNSSSNSNTSSNTEVTGTVSTDGSTSMEKVIGSLGEAFEAENSGITFTYNPTGSGSGITAVSEGRCDIGLSSRALTDEEKESGLTETILALDGIAVIVNKENPTDGLTSDQVKSIYVGDTTDWADVK